MLLSFPPKHRKRKNIDSLLLAQWPLKTLQDSGAKPQKYLILLLCHHVCKIINYLLMFFPCYYYQLLHNNNNDYIHIIYRQCT